MKYATMFFLLILIGSFEGFKGVENTPVLQTLEITEQHDFNLTLPEFLHGEVDKDKLFEYLRFIGVSFPEVVTAQSCLETGWFKSNLAVKKNNLFGMQVPRVRPTTNIAQNGERWAEFEDWRLACIDYKLWQDYTFRNKEIPKDRESYHRVLVNSGYCSGWGYINKIRQIEKQFLP